MIIQDIKRTYSSKINALDLDLIIAHVLKKSRELVLTHPERILSKNQEMKIKNFTKRRIKNEPLAYLLGHKEFYGLNFEVNKHTLIPRPETELLVELATKEILKTKNQKLKTNLIDIGTGSGNIIISLAKNLGDEKISYIATDISQEALRIARKNISKHKLKNKIKVIHSSLLDFIFENKNYKLKTKNLIIIANLPYLSKKIYSATHPTVKNFEPRSALLSSNHGLAHYEKLLKQIKTLAESKNYKLKTTSYFEISPEQKKLLSDMIKDILPTAKKRFYKDLSKRWRVCQIEA